MAGLLAAPGGCALTPDDIKPEAAEDAELVEPVIEPACDGCPRTPGLTTVARQPGQKKVYVEFEDKSDNEEGFVLERKTAEASFVPVGRAPSNVLCELVNPSRKVPCFVDEDRGFHSGVVYTYRAWAYRGGLASNYSSEAQLTFE